MYLGREGSKLYRSLVITADLPADGRDFWIADALCSSLGPTNVEHPCDGLTLLSKLGGTST